MRTLFRHAFALSLFITAAFKSHACDVKGRVISPFKACKDVLIVNRSDYKKFSKEWNKCEQECNLPAQLFDSAEWYELDPLKEGAKYLEFAGRVAERVSENLAKSRMYADCSSRCFSGAKTCPASLSVTNKEVQCSERKIEIIEGMRVQARKLRIELALSNENLVPQNVNVMNVLSMEPDDFINRKLIRFEVATPNPLSSVPLTAREVSEAKRRLALERKKLEEELKEKKVGLYDSYWGKFFFGGSTGQDTELQGKWMAAKLMDNFDRHKENYRKLLFEEAPIFSVIDAPQKWNDNDPVWDDNQIAEAFRKLSQNATTIMNKVNLSKQRAKLEFTRANGEVVLHSLEKWISSDAPDLLYYLSMTRQVEELLKEDPSSCAIATTMAERLGSKDMQNRAVIGTISVAIGPITTKLVAGTAGTFIAAYSGLAVGAMYLGENYQQYKTRRQEAGSSSGLSSQEGSQLGSAKKITRALADIEFSAALLPMDVNLVKTIYIHINQMRGSTVPLSGQRVIVDQWLGTLVERMLKEKRLTEADQAFLATEQGGRALINVLQKSKIPLSQTSNITKSVEEALISAARTAAP